MNRFTLKAPEHLTPGEGEDFGAALRIAADAYLAQVAARTGGGVPDMDRRLAAGLYELAGDAYRSASSVSLGHARRGRYDDAEARCRELAVATRPA